MEESSRFVIPDIQCKENEAGTRKLIEFIDLFSQFCIWNMVIQAAVFVNNHFKPKKPEIYLDLIVL